ncbi:MAG: signal recognition particle protein [Rhodospirillales bacterium]|nr:signal recognition particle protein [Rhodospirillales bacterium]MCB9965617.1 signal recognition particle protein [Rhodospirillales bacterium]MCB9973040.1 signal recognition particle protein [Rhodospirillales bacterium]
MFESLSEKLGGIFGGLRGKALTEKDVDLAAREIRVALLEADVALPVVKEFIDKIKERAVGEALIKNVRADQQVVKIVNDAMIEMLGDETAELEFGPAPSAYLMVGLQGSGKTTTTAKIAKFLTDKQRKKVLMASLDVARPAAQEQLRTLGEQTGIATLEIIKGQSPVEIAKRAMETGRKEGYDVVMLDTAGRLSIDDVLMEEVVQIRNATRPVETLLVVDAMTGQDAVNTARIFHEKIGITGSVLTRIDGDARGGAAMSMKAVTGRPIKLLGTGEKWDALEPFHPDRIASRILGMGDIVSLVEKAAETVDQQEAEKMAAQFKKGQFNYNDLLAQIRQMSKMGGMGAIMKMLPGLGNMMGQLEAAGVDDSIFKKQEAIILSMTKAEREKPELLNASRKKRIAAGAGVTVNDINRLAKQQMQMQTVMKRMKKMGMGGMMKQMKSLMSGKDAAMVDEAMEAEQQAGGGSLLGPNPFDKGSAGGFGGLGGLGGLGGGMPPMGGMGMPGLAGLGGGSKRGVTKKINKRKKR